MALYEIDSPPIRHFKKRKGNRSRSSPAVVSGIVTGDGAVSYWCIFLPVPSNSPRSLCKS